MNNPLATYEAAIQALETADSQSAPEFQHQAVLALTRAGSLDFALSEYHRYGLGEIRHHEDIMGLGGRLYKDLYLANTGEGAREFARLSAEKYEDAYQDTHGYYSGINAATMSLLGGIPNDIVEMRARRILENLPAVSDAPDEEVYFTEATRAEAYILLGDIERAQASLRTALDFDPLNYTAHASTLKQFRMIARSIGADWPWLTEFDPPRAMHFAGHIFGLDDEMTSAPVLSKAQEEDLCGEISNLVQEHDIGFAYGALAAGADILVAETILEEGGELHVVLPTSKDMFLQTSVTPFGASWTARFEHCLQRATTVNIHHGSEDGPKSLQRQRASLIAMGDAIRKSEELAVEAVQILIWDGKKGELGTAKDAQVWRNTGRSQFIQSYPGERAARPHKQAGDGFRFSAQLQHSHSDEPDNYDDISAALSAVQTLRAKHSDASFGLSYDLMIESAGLNISSFEERFGALPGAVYLSELAANYVTVHHSDNYQLDYMGLNALSNRVFALRERG